LDKEKLKRNVRAFSTLKLTVSLSAEIAKLKSAPTGSSLS
jgi:hypothetical protein